DDVRTAVPGRPIVLGEWGVSNDATDEATSAGLELALVRGILDRGGAGGLKWMLNDVPDGANPRENNFGMFRADGSAKPVVDALRAFAQSAPRPASSATIASSQPAPGQPAANPCPAGGQPGATQPLNVGRAVVAGTDGEGVFLRRTPRLDDKLGAWPD